GDNWSVAVTPNDNRNASDGSTVLSNNVLIVEDCPLSIASDTILTENITCPSTAINILASNVVLDCGGFAVRWNEDGGDGTYGILAVSRTNVTVRNCVVIDNSTDGNFGIGINVSNVSNSVITNTTVQANASNVTTGMQVFNSTNVSITNMSIILVANGSDGTVMGILINSSGVIVIANNTVFGTALNLYTGLEVVNSTGPTVQLNTFNNPSATNRARWIRLLFVTDSVVSGNTMDGGSLLKVNADVYGDDSGSDNQAFGNTMWGIVGENVRGFVVNNSLNVFINNNTINLTGNGASTGVLVRNVSNVTVGNMTLNITGISSSGNHTGVEFSNTTSVVFGNNNVLLSGSGSNWRAWIFSVVDTASDGFGGAIQMVVDGPFAAGITVQNGTNFVLRNVTVNVSGSQTLGINLTNATAITLSNIIVRTNGTGEVHSLYAQGVTNARIVNSTLTYLGNSSGLTLVETVMNLSVLQIGLLDVVAPVWASTGVNTLAEFNSTTFFTRNGSLFFGNFTMSGAHSITRAKFNVSSNNTFVNSTNLSFLNTSAQITLRGLSFTDPRPRVDFNDDGVFEQCNPPQCVEVSFTGGVYVFNVSSFTSYAAGELGNVTISVSKSDSPDPVNNGSALSYTVTINNTGSETAFNVTLVELYPSSVVFNNSQPVPSVGNNTWFLGNLSSGSSTTVNITVNVSAGASGTLNNSVNVSFQNLSGGNGSVVVSELTVVNVAVVPPTPGVPSGGGGGGGASRPIVSAPVQVGREFVMTSDAFVTPYLGELDSVIFDVNGGAHLLTVLDVEYDRVLLSVQSVLQEFVLSAGQSKDVDVSGDGVSDLRVQVLVVFNRQVSLALAKLSQTTNYPLPTTGKQPIATSQPPIANVRQPIANRQESIVAAMKERDAQGSSANPVWVFRDWLGNVRSVGLVFAVLVLLATLKFKRVHSGKHATARTNTTGRPAQLFMWNGKPRRNRQSSKHPSK
ncbi:DUF11 domain-containing protein, partial [Candidatus Woesearchaeota archaeon]|nr:DUF11 domain-containing protein [Candidatus Woesearchaeota archaeon]